MKFVKYILLLALAAAFAACSGTKDDSSLPVLEAVTTRIDLATQISVNLKVTYEGADVTSDAMIFMKGSEVPEGNVFVPYEVGSYTFYAVYDGKQSKDLVITVVDSSVKVESRYERHVCLTEFTGAWCINCPSGLSNMMMVLSKPSMKKYVDRIHICAFHSNLEGEDDMAIPAARDVMKLFKGLAYPSFVTDLRNVEGSYGNLTESGISNLQSSILASFRDYNAHCGVAVSSSYDSANSKFGVKVKVTSEFDSVYRVVLLAVENNIVYPQKSTLYPEGDPDYIHNHVVRRVLTEYSGTFTGKKLTDDGRIEVGEEAAAVWVFDADPVWKLRDTEIYALVLDENGYVNNMNVCPILDGDSDYNLAD